MDALLLALLLIIILDQGSGTQNSIARFANRFADGEGVPGPIIAGLALMIVLNAAVGAGLGMAVGALLSPDPRLLFLSMALGLGGIGLCMAALRRFTDLPSPVETTPRFLIRFAIRRAGENAAFATAGVAAFTGAPVLAAVGATIGGWAALALPLSLSPDLLRHGAMRAMQIVAGLGLFCAGLACAVNALHLV